MEQKEDHGKGPLWNVLVTVMWFRDATEKDEGWQTSSMEFVTKLLRRSAPQLPLDSALDAVSIPQTVDLAIGQCTALGRGQVITSTQKSKCTDQ